jgi:hypothetical protein
MPLRLMASTGTLYPSEIGVDTTTKQKFGS